MDARKKRRLGYIMLIHAVVFGVVSFKGDVHFAMPTMFLVAGAVLLRRAREETPRKDHE